MTDVPKTFRRLIGEENYAVDETGMSDSTIMLFSDKVLKIQPDDHQSHHEYRMMQWLQGKLPVPKTLGFESDGKKAYLLMTRLSGEMACTEKNMNDPDRLTSTLAEGLQRLWKVDTVGCPYSLTLDVRLSQAKEAVEKGLVAIDDAEEDTFGENGFKDPEHLLDWLSNNKPAEDLVFSHGDFCLPNILIAGRDVSGYLDLGRAGIADRWQDIALCYRSLLHNFSGKYGGKKDRDFNANILFVKLGIKPEWDKIRYYILLDELF